MTATASARRAGARPRQRFEPDYQDDSTRVYLGDCCEVLPVLGLRADLILTSPPYDDLRTYGGHPFDFDLVADALVATLAPGGVLVWVVGDATVNGSETGTSYRQALGFLDRGLNLWDTMIYEKLGPPITHAGRYVPAFEFICLFSARAAPRRSAT